LVGVWWPADWTVARAAPSCGCPEEDLARRVAGCGDGPVSFNAEATAERAPHFNSVSALP
jgi:hypothetical protein